MLDPIVIVTLQEGQRRLLHLREDSDATRLRARPTQQTFCNFHRPGVTEAAVRDCGRALWQDLSANTRIRQRLDNALSSSNGTRYPLYIKVGSVETENLPWETLWQQQFWDLDRQWPVARLVYESNAWYSGTRAIE